MNQLTEGLLAHDLDYLIMPLISIDEYQSKIDDRKAIVVGIYVTDIEPAQELSSFIEKGVVPVLDTEVSPAPTEDGYYVVFIELDRNERFIKRMLNIAESVSNLTNVDKWEFSPYESDTDESYPLTAEMIKKHINLDPNSVEIKNDDQEDQEPTQSDQIAEFLQNSLVNTMKIEEGQLTLTDGAIEQRFDIVDFSQSIDNIVLSMPAIGSHELMESTRLQTMLGYDYTVSTAQDNILVFTQDAALVLKSTYIG